MPVEDLYLAYVTETNKIRKEQILCKVIKCYEPLQNKLAYKYYNIFPSHEADDWKILIQLGIWEGLEKATDVLTVRRSIYYRIRHQISKEIQLITAAKQTYFHEVTYDLITFGTEEEDRWISKMDIELAIEKLPEKTRKVMQLWMKGLPVLSCHWRETPVDPCICKEVGLKDAAVYFRLQEGFEFLSKELQGYNE